MERFVLIVNGWQPLTIITKRSILDVASALDPPLMSSLILIICASDMTALKKESVEKTNQFIYLSIYLVIYLSA